MGHVGCFVCHEDSEHCAAGHLRDPLSHDLDFLVSERMYLTHVSMRRRTRIGICEHEILPSYTRHDQLNHSGSPTEIDEWVGGMVSDLRIFIKTPILHAL